jgi:hypothetical protein
MIVPLSVNKLFEEYVYAHIAYEIVNTRFGIQEYIVNATERRRAHC